MGARALLALFSMSASLAAQDLTECRPDHLARQTMAALEVMQHNHIAAPPIQEIVRHAIFRLRSASGLEPALGVGRELSDLTTREELTALLAVHWEEACPRLPLDDQRNPQTVASEVVRGVLSEAPGRNELTSRREHTVRRQLAANRYVGIGIALSGGSEGRPPVMSQVFPGGPAAGIGAQQGDVIREIDGTATEGMPLAEVVRRLRGPEGSEVEVLLQQRNEEPRRNTITRSVVRIQSVHVESHSVGGGRIDAIRFDRWTSATVSELRRLEQQNDTPPVAVLLDLQLAEFDLRHALLLADGLLDGGTIGRLETTSGRQEFTASRDVLFRDIPLFILVSSRTTGTPEWLAAALQDRARATILGQQTPGQPYVSESFEVPGTDWVLLLASGILEREGERRLHNPTTASLGQGFPPVDFRRRATPAGRRGERHPGGVLPDHWLDVSPRSETAEQRAMPSLVSIENALVFLRKRLEASL